MWKAFNILFLCVVLPLSGQEIRPDKYNLIVQVLQTAGDFKNIAPVMDIVSRDNDIFRYVPSECPLSEKFRISDNFGYRIHPIKKVRLFHSGVDLATDYAATVHAAADGTVTFSGSMAGYGKTVVIRHKYGFVTQYSHLTYIYRKVGQKVRKGEVIGFVGSTGISTGNHLHYEIIKNDKKINPLNFFNYEFRK